MRLGRVVWQSLKDLWEEILLAIGLSLLWWLALITIIASAPATVALADFGYRIAREQRVSLDEARATLRQHFWLSWRLGLASLLGIIIIAGNLWFYAHLTGWLRIIAVVFIYLALAWLGVTIYVFSLVSAMKTPSARQVYRNAAILAFANPVYSLVIVVVLGLLVAVSIVIPPLGLAVAPALAAILCGHALVDRLELAAERRGKERRGDTQAGSNE